MTASAAPRPRVTPRRPADAGARTTSAIDAVVKWVSFNASANALAASNRSAGSFSSDLATAAATLGGTALRSLVTGARFLGHDLHDDLLGRGAGMRRVPGEHLVEHAAERVDVAPGGDLLLGGGLLGAHVVRRAERHAGLGHPAAGRGTQRQRDAEVGHHRAAVVEQDVLGLDVAVDDAVPVGVVEGIGDGRGDADRLVDAELGLAVEFRAQASRRR